MRGIAKGESTGLALPTLQLIVRSGGFLADIVAGTYKIDEISTGAAVARVAQANFDIRDISAGGHRLGRGRYLIPTGSTSSWNLGTHRVTMSFQLVQSGTSYPRVLDFEVVDPITFPTSSAFVSYVSSRQAYDDGVAPITVSVSLLQKTLFAASRSVEEITGWFFEPRYLAPQLEGADSPILLLPLPIVAVEDVYQVGSPAEGDLFALYEQTYRVMNRHLDGLVGDDDRRNPRLDLSPMSWPQATADSKVLPSLTWPTLRGGLKVAGVWGYLDPTGDLNAQGVSIGQTPEDLIRVVETMALRYRADPLLQNPMTWNPSAIKSYRTRSQAVVFNTSSGGGGGGGGTSPYTGDEVLDRILLRFIKPPKLRYVGDGRDWR